MTTRRFSRLVAGPALLALALVLLNGAPVSAGKGDKSAPSTPTNLKVTAITDSTVSLSWNASSDNSGKFSYRLKITNLANSAFNSTATISQTQTAYSAKFLAVNSPYSFSISAVDDAGNQSGNSNVVNAKTLADTTAPSAPVLQAAAVAPSQVQLTWTRSTDDVPNNCCTFSFKLNGSTITQNINWAPAPANQLSVIIRHLSPGTDFSFNVGVSDYSGNITMSNTASASTPPSSDTTPPSVPKNLHLVQDNSCGEVWLGWDQATDDTDPQSMIEYEIYVNDVLSPLPVSAGVSTDFVYATAFGDNTFYIKAVDRSGNSSAPSQSIKLFLWPC